MTQKIKKEKRIEDNHPEAGFSLLEILVALAIIASLAALVGPRLLGQVDKSKVTTAKVQIKMLETALTTYMADGGSLPNGDDALQVLVRNVNNDSYWAGPYMSEPELPLDPWGTAYVYTQPTQAGDIGNVSSLGADRQPGGSGLNADIG